MRLPFAIIGRRQMAAMSGEGDYFLTRNFLTQNFY